MRFDNDEDWEKPVDMMFITWSLSPTNGAAITFELADRDAWSMLRCSPALAGSDDFVGKIEVMMIELDDEGKPIDVKQQAKMERMALKKEWPKGGPRSIQAARLCADKDFHVWIKHQINWKSEGLPKNPEITPAMCAEWMRKECDLDTRAQLDHDPAALQRFEDKVMSPFLRSQM